MMVVRATKEAIARDRIAARCRSDRAQLHGGSDDPGQHGDPPPGPARQAPATAPAESASRPACARSARPRSGTSSAINGAGRLIGSLDTGVDGNHPALADPLARLPGRSSPGRSAGWTSWAEHPVPERRLWPRHPHDGNDERPRRVHAGHDRRGLGREVDRHQRHQPGRRQRFRQRRHHLLPVVRRSRTATRTPSTTCPTWSRTPGESTRGSAAATPTATAAGGT